MINHYNNLKVKKIAAKNKDLISCREILNGSNDRTQA